MENGPAAGRVRRPRDGSLDNALALLNNTFGDVRESVWHSVTSNVKLCETTGRSVYKIDNRRIYDSSKRKEVEKKFEKDILSTKVLYPGYLRVRQSWGNTQLRFQVCTFLKAERPWVSSSSSIL